jgi:hypothetical protein
LFISRGEYWVPKLCNSGMHMVIDAECRRKESAVRWAAHRHKAYG